MSENSQTESTRRSFLDCALTAGGCACAAGMAAPTVVYLWPAQSTGPGDATVKAGLIKDYQIGSAKMFQSRGRPILVIRVSETEFKAVSAICTHLGCIVQWHDSKQIIDCPCHAASFSANGKVLSGPPPSPLAEYSVVLIGDEVVVKTA